MKKVFCILLLMSVPHALWAQKTEPLVISFFSDFEVKLGQPEIPWAMYYFSLDKYLVHDAIAQMDDGQIVRLVATSADIKAHKGGTPIYSGFPYRKYAPVSRVCFTNFRMCTTRNIKNCEVFEENLFFEVDIKTGAAVTNIPLAPGLDLPAGSAEMQIQLCGRVPSPSV